MYLICERVVNQGLFKFIVGQADNLTEMWSLIFSLGEYRKYTDRQENALYYNSIMVYRVSSDDSDVQELSRILKQHASQRAQDAWVPSCDPWENWLYMEYDTDNDTRAVVGKHQSVLINNIIERSVLVLGSDD